METLYYKSRHDHGLALALILRPTALFVVVVVVIVMVVTVIVIKRSCSSSSTQIPIPIPVMSYHPPIPLFVLHQRNFRVISDVLDSWPCDQQQNMEIQNSASSRLTFVHSVSRFQVLFLCPACISALARPAFPASFRLPTKLVTYISEVSVFHPVRWSGSPGLAPSCQLVGRSVVGCRARANPRGCFFVVVALWW